MQTTPRFALTVGPVQYWWPRATLLDFYARLADTPVDTIVLGEVVCSRRHEMKLADWMALARELRAAGKDVVLATQVLVMGEAELRAARECVAQGEFRIEAGDASALQSLRECGDSTAFVLGPHVNIYSREALVEHAVLGAACWVAPAELALDAVARVNPPAKPVAGPAGDIATEVFVFGRLPLAFSARCFTARHHRLRKDACAFRCLDDPDGMALRSGDGENFLCLNGTQVQSAGVHALLAGPAALREAGVSRLRLSPCSRDFARAVEQFDALYNRAADPVTVRAVLQSLDLPGPLVDGYAHGRPGMTMLRTMAASVPDLP